MYGIIFNILGRLEIEITTTDPERFLNICQKNQIPMDDIRWKDSKLVFTIPGKDSMRLRVPIRKTHSRMKILKRRGIYFHYKKYRNRNCFMIGLLCSFCILYCLSFFLWNITITGNCYVSGNEMIRFLEKHQIKMGTLKTQISCEAVEQLLRNEFSVFTWVSVEQKGTSLIISVKENDEDIIAASQQTPCDLVATKEGIIYSIVTRSGTPLVKTGDYVMAGDVLVSGIIAIQDDYGTVIQSKEVIADADVLIELEYPYEERLRKEYRYRIDTGRENKEYYFMIHNEKIALEFPQHFELSNHIYQSNKVVIGDYFYLPFEYGMVLKKEYIEEKGEYSKDEATNVLQTHFQYFLANFDEKEVQFDVKDVTIEWNGSEYCFNAVVVALEPAFEPRAIHGIEEWRNE